MNSRADAVVGWVAVIPVAFQTAGIASASINPALTLAEADVGIVGDESDIARTFLAKADVAISDFAESPAYRNILDTYGANLPKRTDD